MSIAVTSIDRAAHDRSAAVTSVAFDWTMTVLSALFLGGVFLDGWAHTHGRVDETFFTPWHAALYGGYLATAAVLCGGAAWGRRRGRPWRAALPGGYALSLLGAALWVVGGPFDAAWHEIFGFEVDVEALMSPAHGLLALGFGLMASGPLRAGLRRAPGRWRDELPMLLSMTFVVSILTFFTQIAHPLANLWAAGTVPAVHSVTELGMVGMLLTTALLVGPVLFLLRHGRLPFGALAVMVTLNSVAMGFLYEGAYPRAAVVATAVAAAVAELVRLALRPAASRPTAFRVFALAFPTLLSAAYFTSLALTVGIGWSPHLWLGTIAFSGVVGWVLTYLVLPPRLVAGA